MSQPGKACLVTVRDVFMNPWCGDRGVAVVKIPPRDGAPAYELTVCERHRRADQRPGRDGATVGT